MADREDSNVIDLREFRQTGERISVQEIKDQKQVRSEAALSEIQLRIVEYLRNLTILAEQGRLDSLVVIARSTDGPFHSNVLISPDCTDMTHAYYMAGAIDSMRLQLLDMSAWAPELLEDGSTYTPENFNYEFEEEDGEIPD